MNREVDLNRLSILESDWRAVSISNMISKSINKTLKYKSYHEATKLKSQQELFKVSGIGLVFSIQVQGNMGSMNIKNKPVV